MEYYKGDDHDEQHEQGDNPCRYLKPLINELTSTQFKGGKKQG